MFQQQPVYHFPGQVPQHFVRHQPMMSQSARTLHPADRSGSPSTNTLQTIRMVPKTHQGSAMPSRRVQHSSLMGDPRCHSLTQARSISPVTNNFVNQKPVPHVVFNPAMLNTPIAASTTASSRVNQSNDTTPSPRNPNVMPQVLISNDIRGQSAPAEVRGHLLNVTPPRVSAGFSPVRSLAELPPPGQPVGNFANLPIKRVYPPIRGTAPVSNTPMKVTHTCGRHSVTKPLPPGGKTLVKAATPTTIMEDSGKTSVEEEEQQRGVSEQTRNSSVERAVIEAMETVPPPAWDNERKFLVEKVDESKKQIAELQNQVASLLEMQNEHCERKPSPSPEPMNGEVVPSPDRKPREDDMVSMQTSLPTDDAPRGLSPNTVLDISSVVETGNEAANDIFEGMLASVEMISNTAGTFQKQILQLKSVINTLTLDNDNMKVERITHMNEIMMMSRELEELRDKQHSWEEMKKRMGKVARESSPMQEKPKKSKKKDKRKTSPPAMERSHDVEHVVLVETSKDTRVSVAHSDPAH